MNYHENILGTIGDTPLVKINRITEEIPALVLAISARALAERVLSNLFLIDASHVTAPNQ